jgi:hypothetical protein
MKNFIFLLFIGICISCQSHSETDKVTEVLEELINVEDSLPPTYLAGTKWKLVGIVSIETGDTTELVPKDCEYCYTLTFETDYTAIPYNVSRSSIFSSDLKLNLTPESLNRNPELRFDSFLRMEIYEKDGKYYEIESFRRALGHIESFTVANDELKFFYYPPTEKNCNFDYYFNDKYSLFKRIDL